MRYELYTKIVAYDKYAYFYIIENDHLQLIINYIEEFPLLENEKYIIVDNSTPYPVNPFQLGLKAPPSLEEHYDVIYECKLAKEYHNRIKFEDFYSKSTYEDDIIIPYEAIFTSAKYQTEKYFEDYLSKSEK